MIVSVPKESAPGERRVALVPELVSKLTKAGLEVVVQSGAGAAAGFLDPSYTGVGARIEPEVFNKADVLLKVQPPQGSPPIKRRSWSLKGRKMYSAVLLPTIRRGDHR